MAILLYLNENGDIWTDIYYKDTNNHDYLDFYSHHPTHIKNNIPFVLAKRIIVFTTKDDLVKNHLSDLTNWLVSCNYPITLVKKGIHNAKLQGPAPLKMVNKVIPLISTFYSNYNNTTVMEVAQQLLKNSKNVRLQQAFKEVKLIQAFKQPPNLLRLLSNSSFISSNTYSPKGLFKCKNIRCKLCKLYVQEGSSFVTSNGTNWSVKCYADCNSMNTLYFLQCIFCNYETYTGKTDNLRLRTNNHITGCRHGTSTDMFDNHVYLCSKNNNMPLCEPFFKLNVFMVVNDYNKLRNYETKLHSQGHDTMNR